MRYYLLFFWISNACAANMDLSIRSDFGMSDEPLTTEKIWKLDSHILNPHRQRWVLHKKVKLEGLSTYEVKDFWKVQAKGIEAFSRLHMRDAGPWYREYGDFSCLKKPDDFFSNTEGVKVAGLSASKKWEEILKTKIYRLSLLFSKVSAKSAKLALLKGNLVFQKWIEEVEDAWSENQGSFREEEWTYYLKQTRLLEICPRKKTERVVVPELNWEKMMEPVSHESTRKLLARAPARIWDGMFSIRLSVEVGDKVLSGRFLVDPGAAESILSPAWLEGQGINSGLVDYKDRGSKKISWSRGSEVAAFGQVLKTKISGYEIPITEYWLMDTEVFAQPEYITSCCDGVLGLDFLKNFVVEFSPEAPSEVRLWEKSGFRWDTGNGNVHWFEVSINEGEGGGQGGDHDKVESTCISAPVKCGTHLTYDLPHGRIWFSDDGLGLFTKKNNSGLLLEFAFNADKDRELRVKKIVHKSPADALWKAGLTEGTIITQIDFKPTVDLDIWEIEQRLAGAFGDEVVLQWKAKDVVKVVQMRVGAGKK